MKTPHYVVLAVLLAAPLGAMAAGEAHHHASAAHRMTLDAGAKWATDEPLRRNMTAIRSTAAATLASAHAGKAREADFDAFANEVALRVGDIVQHCKLAPKADAQLHIVIGALMAGVETAQGRRKGAGRAAGVHQVAQALDMYGKYFDHPGWTTLALP